MSNSLETAHGSADESLPSAVPRSGEPLKLSGVLDHYEYLDITPAIGREFPNADLKEWLEAPNSDELLRDLAIMISQRGVVFFRQQNAISHADQKELVLRLGRLSWNFDTPKTSGLHIHPLNHSWPLSGDDDEISVISSEEQKHSSVHSPFMKRQNHAATWHNDIPFEPVSSDYALLRLTDLPRIGGDTLWASGYEVYDRLSTPIQKLLESLTATFALPVSEEVAKTKVYSRQRGAPENVGIELMATHPVIRTNPVTGWKSVYAAGTHAKIINGLTEEESEHFLKWFTRLIVDNHDLQVRHRWQYPNDIAIWDNRSVYHTPTFDLDGDGLRRGVRAVSLGEKPYFDPKSVSRGDSLSKQV
ncbi:hypothetical protein B0J12DRAFT_733792 [Macrophomina phaseolina]|uniref:TauD/TfdA-like domain-containing protein n=1 Tax=Macrophomina phaseolina TaxID=35725 RepID=A0ABQ8FQ03_9PEZI|nr:hypothetical protein B0J12DRAFT_733792 [Macrophomina phaseolina]